MRYLVASLLFTLSLLLPTGVPAAISETNPAAPQLKLQQSPNTPQIEEIRDIKGPVPISETPRFLIPVIIIAVLLILAALIFFILRRKRRPETMPSPPDVLALAELDRARNLMAQPLAYAERISAILRQYIEVRFQIRSTRQTTQEFFSRLKSGTTIAEVDIKTHAGELQDCLEHCDIAKFAHGTPNQERMLGMDRAVRNFIETTRQQETPETGTEKGRP